MPWVWSACSWVISTPSSQSTSASSSCSRRSGEVSTRTRVTLPCALHAFDQQRAAPAAVLRIVRIAGAPAERRARHADRRAAAEDGEGQAHAAFASVRGTLLNSRKKFSVVCRAISSADTPRASASTLAVSTTYAGSLALAAIRQRSEIGRIGLDQDAVGRQGSGDRAQLVGVLERQDAGERDVVAQARWP